LKKSHVLTIKHASKVLGAATTAGIFSMAVMAAKPVKDDGYAGNGAPSGSHYNLNIIGQDREYDGSGTNGNGHRIFVKLWGQTKIMLTEGPFDVLDYNGLDGEASFQLPAADADCDGSSDYSVYVRGHGGGGKTTITTCFTDKATGDLMCDAGSSEVTVIEGGRKPRFTNVSKTLLTVVADIDDDGDLDRTPLFGDDTYGYAWDYNNEGLKLAQFRFYDEYTLLNTDIEEGGIYNCET
jgi:hypothetical protein